MMPIFIVDNGGEYSDHALYFVEADTRADLEALHASSRWIRGYEIIGEASRIEWAAPWSAMTLEEYRKHVAW